MNSTSIILRSVLCCAATAVPLAGSAQIPNEEDLSTPAFHGLSPETVVGGFDAPSGQTIGKIADILALPDGTIVVLDEYYSDIKRYDARGNWLGSIGRGGRGPGELYYPEALSFDGTAGRLLILDRGNLRISGVSIRDEELRLEAFARLPIPALDMCVLNSKVFLLLESGGQTVHEFDVDSERIVKSWGGETDVTHMPDERRRRSAREVMGATLMTCNEDLDLIVLASPLSGWVRAHRPDGTEVWSNTLDDFSGSRVVPVDANGMPGYTFEFESENGTKHEIDRLLPFENRVIVQATLMDFERHESGWGPVTTYVLDSATGETIRTLDHLPLLAGLSGETVAAWANGPTPGVGFLPADAVTEAIR